MLVITRILIFIKQNKRKEERGERRERGERERESKVKK